MLFAGSEGFQVAPATNSRPVPAREASSVAYSEGSFSSSVLNDVLGSFVEGIRKGEIEIYNEFSLQHELGIFLSKTLPGYQVQFERNVSYFGLTGVPFVKREIDIVIYRKNEALLDAAIELKFPRNGQYPEQMFSFCKDVVFTEQLKRAGFNKAYTIIFAEDRLFYEGSQKDIYGLFRGSRNLSGRVTKPTGNRDTVLEIKGNYKVVWTDVAGLLKYTIIETA